jgi:hypothetical protein
MSENESFENDSKDFQENLGVLNKITSELSKLSPEERERILNAVMVFFNITPYSHTLTEQSTNQINARPLGPERISQSFSEDRSMSPKSFLLQKQPRTDIEKVTCLAYYLTHYRQTPHFKTIDISKLNTEAAQRKFSNAAKAVDNASRSSLLVPSTKGQKQLGAAGELYVQALPDHDAAKEAIKNLKPRRKKPKPLTKRI